MKLFKKKRNPAAEVQIVSAQRGVSALQTLPNAVEPFEKALYDRLRFAVPVIDAALTKIIRLTGGFRVVCDDEDMQAELDSFLVLQAGLSAALPITFSTVCSPTGARSERSLWTA